MKRYHALTTALLFALAACGGGEPAAEAGEPMEGGQEAMEMEGSQELSMPDWFRHDAAANTVTMDIVAGQTSASNYWNFNGYVNGAITVVVPVGASVTINFSNQDPAMAHSIGVASFTSNPPAMLEPTPVFAGAITSNPTDMMNSTKTGASESITFTADQAGEYSLACYVAGHAVAGMWVHFNVSASGEAGVQGAM